MTPERLFRLSGVALILGSLLTAVAVVTGDSIFYNDPKAFTNPLWVPLNLSSLIGSMLVLLGLPGMYARQAARAGWPGLVGFVLTFFAGLIMGVAGPAILAFIPTFSEPTVPNIFLSLMFSAGVILLGAATMRAGILPRWAGLLLVIAGCGVALENLVSVEPLATIISDGSGVLFMLGILWFGYALLTQKGVEEAPSPFASAQ
ncbi:MAG TPA: hypothetical protein VEL69_10805 [Ktedonobacteraceae bacterium]|nr:hypothetical protein [Ktedonobacteraceae bacterium]